MVSILRKNARERRGKRSDPSARRTPTPGELCSSLFLMQASRGDELLCTLMTLPRGRKYDDRNRAQFDLLLILRKGRVAKREGMPYTGV